MARRRSTATPSRRSCAPSSSGRCRRCACTVPMCRKRSTQCCSAPPRAESRIDTTTWVPCSGRGIRRVSAGVSTTSDLVSPASRRGGARGVSSTVAPLAEAVANPYMGLRAFGEADARHFRGRDAAGRPARRRSSAARVRRGRRRVGLGQVVGRARRPGTPTARRRDAGGHRWCRATIRSRSFASRCSPTAVREPDSDGVVAMVRSVACPGSGRAGRRHRPVRGDVDTHSRRRARSIPRRPRRAGRRQRRALGARRREHSRRLLRPTACASRARSARCRQPVRRHPDDRRRAPRSGRRRLPRSLASCSSPGSTARSSRMS